MMTKATKKSVNYRPVEQRSNGGKCCGNCVMFQPGAIKQPRVIGRESGNGTCSLVEGQILSDYVCDRWEGK